MILVDSVYIHNSGGKFLLDYLIENINKKGIIGEFYFLVDSRYNNDILSESKYLTITGSEKNRKKFYKKNKNIFKKVFCFGNVPPPLKIDCEVITYFHNILLVDFPSSYPLKSKVSKFLKRLYIIYRLRNTDTVFVQTKHVKNVFSKVTGYKNIEVLPFFNLNTLYKKANKNKGFVYISNANPHKNHDILLDAWLKLKILGHSPNLHLTVTNEYPMTINKIESYKSKGVNIINHGYTKILNLFDLCDILIYPSSTESFGLGLVEAVNAGLNVIASSKPFVYEVVEPSYNFNERNSDSIVKSVLISLQDNNIPISKIKVENKINHLINILTKNETNNTRP